MAANTTNPIIRNSRPMDDPLLYVVVPRTGAFRPAGCGGRERQPSGLRPAQFGLPGQFAVPICRPSIALGLAQASSCIAPTPRPNDPRSQRWPANWVIRGGMEGGAGASWRQQCVNGAGPNSHGWDRTAERAISNAATTTRHSRCRTLRARAVACPRSARRSRQAQ
jgi:hypothetical protein